MSDRAGFGRSQKKVYYSVGLMIALRVSKVRLRKIRR
jgi:hypothetical protein